LSLEESLAALVQAGKVGVRGGRVHDFLHAMAAAQGGRAHEPGAAR
jgi:hypothetical protein